MTNESPRPERVAFWLLPAPDDHDRLKAVIDACAARFGTIPFAPHLTLHVMPSTARPDPADRLERVIRRTAPLQLDVCGTPLWSPAWNRALVLPLELSSELADLVASLHGADAVPEDYFPHISLAYGDLDREIAERVAAETYRPGGRIRFDRVAAVGVGARTASAADVRSWETVATRTLGRQPDRP